MTTVWHISSNRWNSAITEYALSACLATERLGWRTFFTPLHNSAAEKRAKHHGLETYGTESFGYWSAKNFYGLCHDIKPDYIICYGGKETSLALRLRSYIKRKSINKSVKVVRLRGYEIRPGWMLSRRINMAYRSVDMMWAPSEKIAGILRASLKSERVHVVGLGIDESRFSFQDSGQGKDITRRELVVLGRFDPVKGHQKFAMFFNKLLEIWPSHIERPIARIIGEPANLKTEEIEKYFVEAKVPKENFNIQAERVDELSAVFSRAAVGVVPSTGSEIICRVAQEFLLCGLPVLVNDVGSLAEVVSQCGFKQSHGIFKEGDCNIDQLDSKDIAKVRNWLIEKMHEDDKLRSERALYSRDLYSIASMTKRIGEVLGAQKTKT